MKAEGKRQKAEVAAGLRVSEIPATSAFLLLTSYLLACETS
jgi:hypothetical protein